VDAELARCPRELQYGLKLVTVSRFVAGVQKPCSWLQPIALR